MMVQSGDGRLHHLTGRTLPDSMTFYTGIPYSGAHLAEVLLNPKDAVGSPLLANPKEMLHKRDAFVLLLGLFAYHLIRALAESVAYGMTG